MQYCDLSVDDINSTLRYISQARIIYTNSLFHIITSTYPKFPNRYEKVNSLDKNRYELGNYEVNNSHQVAAFYCTMYMMNMTRIVLQD